MMQDKHIDETFNLMMFNLEPSEREIVYRHFRKEQLAILERLPITGIIGRDGIRRDYVPLEAIQAEIDKIGGKNG